MMAWYSRSRSWLRSSTSFSRVIAVLDSSVLAILSSPFSVMGPPVRCRKDAGRSSSDCEDRAISSEDTSGEDIQIHPSRAGGLQRELFEPGTEVCAQFVVLQAELDGGFEEAQLVAGIVTFAFV